MPLRQRAEIQEMLLGVIVTRPHGISWLNRPGFIGETWNPVVGHRIQAMGPASHYRGTTQVVNGRPVWTGKIARASDKVLHAPLHWRKRRMVFVNSMGDLFHPDVPDAWRDEVFAVMALCPQHVFLVLTKRPEVMRDYLTRDGLTQDIITQAHRIDSLAGAWMNADYGIGGFEILPLSNLWLGVLPENQEQANARIPVLLATPAAVRFVSVEPMLEMIDLRRWTATAEVTCKKCGKLFWLHNADPCHHRWTGPWTLACPNCGDCKCVEDEEGRPTSPLDWTGPSMGRFDFTNPNTDIKSGIDWVICGGESGPDRRAFDPAWARDLRDQCAAAGVPYFFKQHGHRQAGDDLLDGKQYHAWPEAVA